MDYLELGHCLSSVKETVVLYHIYWIQQSI